MTYTTLPSSPQAKPETAPVKKSASPLIILAAVGLLAGLIPFFFILWPEYQRVQLVKNGLPAQGEIISAEPTGSVYNSQPEVVLRVRVTPETGEPYEAATKMIINPVYISQFQPGMKLKIRYDANDRAKIAVEETESGQR